MQDRIAATLLTAALAVAGWAQEAKKPELTAEQVIEKSIEATGGRKAIEKVTSTVAKATLEIGPQRVPATLELYAKAPDKRLVITNLEGFGEVRQGCDGKGAWAQDPIRGLRVLEGAELADAQLEAIFNAELKWRELYPKVELTGKEKVGERDAYVIRFTPTSGRPVTRYFDAQNFLWLRYVATRDTPQGPMEIQVDSSDYRDVDGIKVPFQMKQIMPAAEILVTLTEIKNNVPIDDAKFAKPAK